jgi:hypothetical protein
VSEEKFDQWGIVELFGHQRVAGRITEQAVGGCNFVRVDIPKGEGFYTRLFGNGAIYAINVTDEQIARSYAERFASKPTYAYEIEQQRIAPARSSSVGYDPDEEYDEDRGS